MLSIFLITINVIVNKCDLKLGHRCINYFYNLSTIKDHKLIVDIRITNRGNSLSIRVLQRLIPCCVFVHDSKPSGHTKITNICKLTALHAERVKKQQQKSKFCQNVDDYLTSLSAGFLNKNTSLLNELFCI